MEFHPGFSITPLFEPLSFRYGVDVFGPAVELRTLDAIRPSLMDPNCSGPGIVYAIAMDVAKMKHRALLQRLHLLFGVVTFAAGRLGREPVRSQGHVHSVSAFSGSSTPEVYEIWSGRAIIYMQQHTGDDPGCCYAVEAEPGQVVVVPPGWAHATISADPQHPLVFGAWCVRDYAFDYQGVRLHKGLAWFPLSGSEGQIEWIRNGMYNYSPLIVKAASGYPELDIVPGKPIYTQFEEENERFSFVAFPNQKKAVWSSFVP